VCLSLSASEVKTDRHRPQIISSVPFLTVELASRDALRRARPTPRIPPKPFRVDDSDAVYSIRAMCPSRKAMRFAARMFHPGAKRVVRRSRTAARPPPQQPCSPIWIR